ncbi:MAG: rod shape-determining protein RodA [Flavobacteriales bacterium]|nr:rod shape-determining protein RodA [Flavobacteriales bacterium]
MRNRINIFQNVDWALITIFLTLMLMGWLNIYAATYSEDHQSLFDFSQSYGKQLLWIGTALGLGIVILMLEERFFSTFSNVIYLGGILLLIAVLIFGKEIKGAKSWFVIANIISLQPSEIAKYGTALALSKFVGEYNVKMQSFKSQFQAATILIIPIILILLQPDPGSVLVFCSFIFAIYREGLSGNILLIGLGAIVLFMLAIILRTSSIDLPFELILDGKYILIIALTTIAGIVFWLIKNYKQAKFVVSGVLLICIGYIMSVDYIFENVLKSHHQDRINDLLGVTFDPSGAGYNVNQSKIAIGSGGFSGKGFLQGTQTKLDFVPEQSTDFIFCTVGEEWGFIGSFVVISLFMFLIIKIIAIAERQKAKFSRVFCYCAASIFFLHFMINLGMTIGLAPVIGIPLPFFSYGGSSLWSFTILIFTVIRLDSERKYLLG